MTIRVMEMSVISKAALSLVTLKYKRKIKNILVLRYTEMILRRRRIGLRSRGNSVYF